MESASKYKNVSDGIYRHAYYMINAGFAETKDAVARYYGSHLGNKNSGVNVKYASDPYWGEKIASYYYSIDNYSDLKDYKSVKIGIKVTDTPVPVKKEANNSSLTLYKLESYYNDVSNMSVVILDKVAGETIDGNSTWYKIQTDALLNENRDDLIRDTTINDHYNWDNNYGYVHSSYITLMDENVNNEYIKKDGLFALEELSLTEDKKIIVLPTKTIPQGISAMIGYMPEAGVDENEENMKEAYQDIASGQVTYAVRDTVIDGKEIHNGDIMGINDDGIAAVGKNLTETTLELLSTMADEDSELICLYYGADVTKDDADTLSDAIEDKFPECEVEVNFGGQPIYYYMISVE